MCTVIPFRHHDSGSAAEMATVQVPVPVLGTLADIRDRFFALCLDAGRQVLTAMMEQERTEAGAVKFRCVIEIGEPIGQHAELAAG